ncbi:DUF4205-containing protein [Aureococcus anophagefferens]|nr:DUF4205-containing protein [Aureococcus anophagefferens]
MAPLRLLRAVAVALAVSRAAGQDYVSQALANSFSVDGDASVRAVRIMLNGDNSVLTVAWDDDRGRRRRVLRARQLEDAANREVGYGPLAVVGGDTARGAADACPAHKAAWRKMWATSRGGGAAGESGDGGAFESWYASMFAAPVSGSDGGAVVLEAEDADSDSWSDVDGDGDAPGRGDRARGQDHLARGAPPREAAPKRA